MPHYSLKRKNAFPLYLFTLSLIKIIWRGILLKKNEIERIPKHYQPHELEEEVKQFWRQEKIPQQVKEKNRDKEPFYFIDGPPYASGRIHLGTAWNKVLKDVAIRYYTHKGYNVRRQPGWDMHGLPIEVKTEEKLGIDIKKEIHKMGVKKFIDQCKTLALENKDLMEEQMKNLAIWMDWDNPYMTIKQQWIESEWAVLKKAWEKGLLYQDLKVMTWCKRCETALAEHEVEYEQIEDPSIYVKFPLKNRENEYVLIWTTTPWTLPANMAVVIHPEYTYVQVKVDDERWWLAKKRLDPVMKEIGRKDYSIVDKKQGHELQGLKYHHLFLDEYEKQKTFATKGNTHQLINAETVELTEGTGCVHIATGHGKEDLEIGKKHNLPVYSPVGESGRYTEGTWKGMDVKEADPKIIEKLKNDGFLIYAGKITHRYPVCWRCKTPLLFRSTKQWFLNVEKLKPSLIERNKKNVDWIPSWTQTRFLDGAEKVGDWCISRQRYWNTPIPLWTCEKCGHKEMVGSIEELKEKATTSIDTNGIDLHRPFVDDIRLNCPQCDGEMTRTQDVLDVWFDSGVAPWASLNYPNEKELFNQFWPGELVIEGQDQILKWFYVQQILGLIFLDEIPYKRVVMHGFVLDKDGRKMSKSLGNIVTPEEIIDKYSIDILRLYLVSSTRLGSDMRFSYEEIDQMEDSIHILWNLFYLATRYMEMDEFSLATIDQKKVEEALTVEDQWIVSYTKKQVKQLEQKLDAMELPKVVRQLLTYFTEDLSRWYGKLIRERLWIEEEDPAKQAVYLTFYHVFKLVLPIFAIFAPHLAEFLYQQTVRKIDPNAPQSVHLLEFPTSKGRNKELEQHMKIARKITSAGLAVRQKTNIKLRWPLQKAVIETEEEAVTEAVNPLRSLLKNTLNVKSIEISEVERRIKCHPSYGSLGPKYKEKADEIAAKIRKIDGKPVKKALENKREYLLEVNGKEYKITKEDLQFEMLPPENYVSGEIPGGHILLYTEREAELQAEGYARDLVRRIQEMRKAMNLEMQDQIKVGVTIPNKEQLQQSLLNQEWKQYIKHETRATTLKFSSLPNPDYSETWTIAREKVTIDITAPN